MIEDEEAHKAFMEADRLRLAALAQSALTWRKNAADALDSIMPRMIAEGWNIAAQEFKTASGRPCIVVLAVGEDMVNVVKESFKEQQDGK
jgi:hypothetical protein